MESHVISWMELDKKFVKKFLHAGPALGLVLKIVKSQSGQHGEIVVITVVLGPRKGLELLLSRVIMAGKTVNTLKKTTIVILGYVFAH